MRLSARLASALTGLMSVGLAIYGYRQSWALSSLLIWSAIALALFIVSVLPERRRETTAVFHGPFVESSAQNVHTEGIDHLVSGPTIASSFKNIRMILGRRRQGR